MSPEDEAKLAELEYEQKTLLEEIAAYEAKPTSLNPPGSFKKFTPRAERHLDMMRRGIASIIRQKKLLRGEPVNDEDYSGRQSNRR